MSIFVKFSTGSKVIGPAGYSATRCRIVECIQVITLNTRHVPAGSYAGVLATRYVVGVDIELWILGRPVRPSF